MEEEGPDHCLRRKWGCQEGLTQMLSCGCELGTNAGNTAFWGPSLPQQRPSQLILPILVAVKEGQQGPSVGGFPPGSRLPNVSPGASLRSSGQRTSRS